MDRYENILIFGNPGTGKSHLSIGLAREWCLTGRKVFYSIGISKISLKTFLRKISKFPLTI
jgi:DNA replication protein DnaC